MKRLRVNPLQRSRLHSSRRSETSLVELSQEHAHGSEPRQGTGMRDGEDDEPLSARDVDVLVASAPATATRPTERLQQQLEQLTVERTAKREPDAATHGAAAAASAPGGTGAGGGETEEWSLEGWLESLRLQDVVAAALRTSEV